MTVLFVTHQPADAMRVADDMVFLEEGAVAAAGPTETLFGDSGPSASAAMSEPTSRNFPEADIIDKQAAHRGHLAIGDDDRVDRTAHTISRAQRDPSTRRTLCCRSAISAEGRSSRSSRQLSRAARFAAAAGPTALLCRLPGAFRPVDGGEIEIGFRTVETRSPSILCHGTTSWPSSARAQHPRILATMAVNIRSETRAAWWPGSSAI